MLSNAEGTDEKIPNIVKFPLNFSQKKEASNTQIPDLAFILYDWPAG